MHRYSGTAPRAARRRAAMTAVHAQAQSAPDAGLAIRSGHKLGAQHVAGHRARAHGLRQSRAEAQTAEADPRDRGRIDGLGDRHDRRRIAGFPALELHQRVEVEADAIAALLHAARRVQPLGKGRRADLVAPHDRRGVDGPRDDDAAPGIELEQGVDAVGLGLQLEQRVAPRGEERAPAVAERSVSGSSAKLSLSSPVPMRKLRSGWARSTASISASASATLV